MFVSRNDPLLAHLGLTSLDAVKAYRSPHLVKNHRGHRDILRIETTFDGEPRTLFLKRVWKSAKKDGIKSLFRRGRVHSVSRIEWDNYDALRAAGIPTPDAVALGEEVGPLWENFSFILTAAAPGVPLDEFLRTTPDRKQVVHDLALFVRRLHDAGLYSPDLFTRHVFVSPSGFTLIDMARLDRSSPASDRLRARDLASLNITAPLSMVTRAQRVRFLHDYDPAATRLIPRIRRRVNYLLRRRKYEPFLR